MLTGFEVELDLILRLKDPAVVVPTWTVTVLNKTFLPGHTGSSLLL